MRAGEQGFLLLTSQLGDPDRRVLSAPQLRKLTARMTARDAVKDERELNEKDLLELGYSSQLARRIIQLLEDTALLEHYLRRAKHAGCVPITRVSEDYPLLLRKRLGGDSPGSLWAKGDVKLLERPAVSLVGSRELREENRLFARMAGYRAAEQGFVLVSGNARGADRTAQEACLEAGGSVISIVADELQNREPGERMLYLSEDGFDLPFSAQRALSRNRCIHALGWRTFVAQCTLGTGGTWDGSVRNLRHGYSPLFCFDDGSEAFLQLVDMGAEPVTMEMLSDFSRLEGSRLSFFD